MTQNLQDLITKTLGVVSTPSAGTTLKQIVTAAKSVISARPAPRYEYRVNVSRSEYGSVYVTAESADDAYDIADIDDVSWDDYGDTNWDDAEQISDEPVNQHELEEWDEQYGNRYSEDGTPKCSGCLDEAHVDQLTLNPGNDNEWFCQDCYEQYV